jgi:broad specificity phosphatase PhoE
MSRFIDFIRHGATVLPEGETNDRERILSSIGVRQAQAFGQARKAAGERYQHVIVSGIPRTIDTAQRIIMMQNGSQVYMVEEMFDPETPDKYSLVRQVLYEQLGAQPLIAYSAKEHIDAMLDLGMNARTVLLTVFEKNPGNILVVGHGVYTNQIIFSTFNTVLSENMMDNLLDDPPLQPCAGYRLVFDDNGNLVDMIDLPPPTVD